MTSALDKIIARAERLADEAEARGDQAAVMRHLHTSLTARQLREKQRKMKTRRTA